MNSNTHLSCPPLKKRRIPDSVASILRKDESLVVSQLEQWGGQPSNSENYVPYNSPSTSKTRRQEMEISIQSTPSKRSLTGIHHPLAELQLSPIVNSKIKSTPKVSSADISVCVVPATLPRVDNESDSDCQENQNCGNMQILDFSSQDSNANSKRGRPRLEAITGLIIAGAVTKDATIRCNVCSRVFPREKSLQAHMRTHTGERPYRCSWAGCEKSFAQSGQLRTHFRLHTGEKPFICLGAGCMNRFTHANRHCPDHPGAGLRREKQDENSIMKPMSSNDHDFENGNQENTPRRPAKARQIISTQQNDSGYGNSSSHFLKRRLLASTRPTLVLVQQQPQSEMDISIASQSEEDPSSSEADRPSSPLPPILQPQLFPPGSLSEFLNSSELDGRPDSEVMGALALIELAQGFASRNANVTCSQSSELDHDYARSELDLISD